MDTTGLDIFARQLATRRTVVAAGIGVAAAAVLSRGAAQDATPADCPTLSPDEMETQAQALIDAWNSRDLGELERLFNPDHMHHWGGMVGALDLESYLATMQDMWDAFDDLTFTTEDIVAAGDIAVIRLAISGTQVQDFQGYPPGGRSAAWSAIAIVRFRCGLISEAWVEANHLGRLQQQGSIPAPGQATPAS